MKYHSIEKYILSGTLALFSLSCKNNLPVDGSTTPMKSDVCQFVADIGTKHQTIDNFGASDCWSMPYIGFWPQKKQQQMADWLFSTETDAAGNPKGIGLSLWRFNIGAGSKEQGNKSGIVDEWRRAECFLNADGIYNWNKQQGQRNFVVG